MLNTLEDVFFLLQTARPPLTLSNSKFTHSSPTFLYDRLYVSQREI
jgi:hypothetical protein